MKEICILCLVLSITQFVWAQKVGIGTTSPHSSAALDISSTNGGLLLPRMTYAQRNGIVNPVGGLIIWCSDCTSGGELQIYNGTQWSKFQLSAASVPMQVGAPFGGGIIAYIFQPGDPGYIAGQTHGLIAATLDQSTNAEWGCAGDAIAAFGTALGTGQNNTSEVVSECNELAIAAKICDVLVSGGFSDWFLPSKDELNKLYINRVAIGGFTSNLYWSSSVINEFDAWSQDFTNGSQLGFPRNFDVYVRAIRYF